MFLYHKTCSNFLVNVSKSITLHLTTIKNMATVVIRSKIRKTQWILKMVWVFPNCWWEAKAFLRGVGMLLDPRVRSAIKQVSFVFISLSRSSNYSYNFMSCGYNLSTCRYKGERRLIVSLRHQCGFECISGMEVRLVYG